MKREAGVFINVSGLLMVLVVGPLARNVPPMSAGVMTFFGVWSLAWACY